MPQSRRINTTALRPGHRRPRQRQLIVENPAPTYNTQTERNKNRKDPISRISQTTANSEFIEFDNKGKGKLPRSRVGIETSAYDIQSTVTQGLRKIRSIESVESTREQPVRPGNNKRK